MLLRALPAYRPLASGSDHPSEAHSTRTRGLRGCTSSRGRITQGRRSGLEPAARVGPDCTKNPAICGVLCCHLDFIGQHWTVSWWPTSNHISRPISLLQKDILDVEIAALLTILLVSTGLQKWTVIEDQRHRSLRRSCPVAQQPNALCVQLIEPSTSPLPAALCISGLELYCCPPG